MKDLLKAGKIETDFFYMKLIGAFAYKKFSETEYRGKHLAYNGCNCGARNSEIENAYENKVKDNIEKIVENRGL